MAKNNKSKERRDYTRDKIKKIKFRGEWAVIQNLYGKMLTYNLPRYNDLYANLKYQSYITRMLRSNKYDIFLDVGAYTGLFSQVAANHCKQVYSFEAHPFYYGVLLYNMRNYKNVKCIYKHTSGRNIIPKLHSDDPMCFVVSHINKRKDIALEDMPVLEKYEIETTTLDDEFIHPKNSKTLIKLDIEGYELNLLKESPITVSNPDIDWVIDVHLRSGVSIKQIKIFFENRKIELIGKKVLKITEEEINT